MLNIKLSPLFLRINLQVFVALVLVSFFLSSLVGYSFWKILPLLLLITVPVSILLMFLLERLSQSVVDNLHGTGSTREDNTTVIANSEIVKLIALKEKGKHEAVLAGLHEIEAQYGLSSRVVYERALCLMEIGELRKARRVVKDFLAGVQIQKPDDSYHQFCKQLITHKNAPLTLENINAVSKK